MFKIQGHVVDLRPISEFPPNWKYRSIYDPYWQAEYETAGGHRGVNCQHLHIPFIPGVNTIINLNSTKKKIKGCRIN
nr:phage minor capsid protein [Enterococcus faecium]